LNFISRKKYPYEKIRPNKDFFIKRIGNIRKNKK